MTEGRRESSCGWHGTDLRDHRTRSARMDGWHGAERLAEPTDPAVAVGRKLLGAPSPAAGWLHRLLGSPSSAPRLWAPPGPGQPHCPPWTEFPLHGTLPSASNRSPVLQQPARVPSLSSSCLSAPSKECEATVQSRRSFRTTHRPGPFSLSLQGSCSGRRSPSGPAPTALSRGSPSTEVRDGGGTAPGQSKPKEGVGTVCRRAALGRVRSGRGGRAESWGRVERRESTTAAT